MSSITLTLNLYDTNTTLDLLNRHTYKVCHRFSFSLILTQHVCLVCMLHIHGKLNLIKIHLLFLVLCSVTVCVRDVAVSCSVCRCRLSCSLVCVCKGWVNNGSILQRVFISAKKAAASCKFFSTDPLHTHCRTLGV